MLTMGVDDAGRGPVIGPMVLAGVLVNENMRSELRALGVKDSKQVLHPKRVRLARAIKEKVIAYKIVKSTPEQLDNEVIRGRNLNTLEAIKTAEVINAMNNRKDKIKVHIDCPSPNSIAWKRTLMEFIEHPANLDFVCEHKADVNFVEVSAASILAKVAREEEVEKIKKEFGEIGSGYSHDPVTREFVEKNARHLENSGIFRKSWSTWNHLSNSDKRKQAKLNI